MKYSNHIYLNLLCYFLGGRIFFHFLLFPKEVLEMFESIEITSLSNREDFSHSSHILHLKTDLTSWILFLRLNDCFKFGLVLPILLFGLVCSQL